MLSAAHQNSHPDFVIYKGDSGATTQYFPPRDQHVLVNIVNKKGPPVTFPNNVQGRAVQSGNLPLSSFLSKDVTKTMILPAHKSTNLVSLGQLCDDGCKITLDKNTLLATKNYLPVFQGYRNHCDSLWDIPIQKTIITSNNFRRPAFYKKCFKAPSVNNLSYKSKPSTPKDYINIFADMETIFDNNECDYHVNAQLKDDNKNYFK